MILEGGDASERQSAGRIHALFVDDDREYAAMASRLLEQQEPSIDVSTAVSASDALEMLDHGESGGGPGGELDAESNRERDRDPNRDSDRDPNREPEGRPDVDVIVSDFSMSGMDGLTLLDTVRSEYPDLPFILLTGQGSETIASTAISRGADDYISKGTGTDLAELLTNRITNAVERTRSRTTLERREERFEKLITNSPSIICVLAPDGTFKYVSPSVTDILGYGPEELVDTNAFEKMHPADREAVFAEFSAVVEQPGEVRSAQYRYESAAGEWQWLEAHGNNLLDDPAVGGIVVNVQDVTERKARERELERQNERLDEFTSVVSHDLRNPLTVAMGHLGLAHEECDSHHLAKVANAHDRMEALINDLLTLAKQGESAGETRTVDLEDAVQRAWETTATRDGTLELPGFESPSFVEADPERLDELLENLFRNAIEHCGPDVTVGVGPMADGFFVADDGPGIPEENREAVFDHGFTTGAEGTGFGLSIVRQIAEAHGWAIDVTENEAGGTRFEISTGDHTGRSV